MANPHPQKVKRTRDIEMPTRERILSLIKILQDFDKDCPIKKSDLSDLLFFEYCNYILSQFYNELVRANCSDLSSVKKIIDQLKKDNIAQYKELARKIYGSTAWKSKGSLKNHENLLSTDVRKKLLDRVIQYGIACSFDRDNQRTPGKLLHALHDIRNDVIIDCASTATLTSDLAVLMNPDYNYARTPKKRNAKQEKTPENCDTKSRSKGVFGRFEYNLLDVWQLKIIIETMSSILFLEYSDVKALNDTILHVTSASKLEEAQSICHELNRDYYSVSSTFRNNLKALISAHVTDHNVTFNYQHSTVDRSVKNLDPKSPYTVFPVDIVFKDNFFYLLGASDLGVRPYRIDRIIDLEQSNYNPGFLLKHPEYTEEKELFYKNNTNNFSSGEQTEVVVRWDYSLLSYYTPLFDVFGYANISQGEAEDQFIIKTRDNEGLYLNLLRLGPVIQVLGPLPVKEKYGEKVRQMYENQFHPSST